MIKNLISLISPLALLFALHASGLISQISLSHPWWHSRATLIGAAIGLCLGMALFALSNRNPGAAKITAILVAIVFAIGLITTRYNAQIFINSSDFEALAGQIWFIGYHVIVALFVPLAAFLVRRTVLADKA